MDVPRLLVARDPRAAVLDQLPGGRRAAILQDDAGRDRLAEFLVRHADHRRVGHRRMVDQGDLDLLGIDVQPAGHDHVLGAVDEVEIPVRVEIAHVAGAEPPVLERRFGGRGIAEIFAHHDRAAGLAAAHQQLARLAPGHVVPVRADRADLDAEDRPARRVRPRLLLLGTQRGDVPGLGLGEEGVEPDMRDRRPQALLDRDREHLSRGDDQPEGRSRLRPLLELRRHHAEDGRNAARDGHLLALDQRQRVGRVEARLHDEAAADRDRVGEPAQPRAVRHRGGRQHHVALAQLPLRHVCERGDDEVRVGRDRALGPPRRPRGIGDHAVVGRRRRGGRRLRGAGVEERGKALLPRLRSAGDDPGRFRNPVERGGDGLPHAFAVEHRPGFAVADDVGDLLRGEPRRERHDQRAELEDRRHRLDQLDPVRHGESDPVAAADPAGGQRIGQPVAARVEPGEGQPAVLADQRDLVRVAPGILREQGGELHPASGSKAK